MDVFNLSLHVFVIIFTLAMEVAGVENSGVEGTLGDGRRFFVPSVNPVGSVERVEVGKECCDRCEEEYSNVEMADFYKNDKICRCYKRHATGRRPLTIGVGFFTGFCGDKSIQVDGEMGEGISFTFDSVEFLNNVDFVEDVFAFDSVEFSNDVVERGDCCQQCRNVEPDTEMFKFFKMSQSCNCYRTIPGKIPVTFNNQFFADVC